MEHAALKCQLLPRLRGITRTSHNIASQQTRLTTLSPTLSFSLLHSHPTSAILLHNHLIDQPTRLIAVHILHLQVHDNQPEHPVGAATLPPNTIPHHLDRDVPVGCLVHQLGSVIDAEVVVQRIYYQVGLD